jgi:quinol monooxygenase YgiN
MATPDEVNDVTLVTMRFEVADESTFLGAVSRYVVLSRTHPGARNIDLCRSVSTPGAWLVLQKWSSQIAQREHLDHADTIHFAQVCTEPGVLAAAPRLELLEGVSAHDLA